MTGQEPYVRERTDALDALGNTTAAMGKGFAIGSAALTAMALLAAYIEEVRFGQLYQARDQVVEVFDTSTPDQAVYLGHGKFACWHQGDDKDEIATEDVRAYMMLTIAEEVAKKLEPMKTKIELTERGNVDNEWVNAAHIVGGDAKATFEVVSARRASLPQFMTFYNVTLMNPKVLCGLFAGVLLAFLFCSLTMEAVG